MPKTLAWLLAAALLAAPASAQINELELRAEGAGGVQLPDHQRDVLAYDGGMLVAFRPAYRFADILAIQLGVAGQFFPSANGTGQLFSVGGGARFEPMLGDVGRLFIDANASWGLTGDLNRFTFDAAVGFEFELHPLVALGPVVRYSHLFATEDDFPSDAISVWGGISLVVRAGERQAARAPDDTDGDGVLDPDDLCPRVPMGDNPDPERLGCPMGDRDSDGVNDRDDLCPDTPQGDHPDPDRRGCPAGDADGDSVLDPDDACPTVPQGEHPDPQRPGCPAPDRDSDTVVDPIDQCPEVHMGSQPDPARLGCPLPDRDNDTVVDPVDACPDEPGAPNEDPRLNGCPSLVHIQGGQIHINRPVFFAHDSDEILSRSLPVMRALRDALRASTIIRRISIEGHTDDNGEEAYNLELSNRRARSVMTWLIENGIEPERMEAQGFGESRPLVNETTARARAINRRVEFHILDPAQPRQQPQAGGAQ